MDAAAIRFLFGYDRWATEKVLAAASGLGPDAWGGGEAVGTRVLADVLTHALGAHQRWHAAWRGLARGPRPERGRRLSPAKLRARWAREWAILDVIDYVAYVARGAPG